MVVCVRLVDGEALVPRRVEAGQQEVLERTGTIAMDNGNPSHPSHTYYRVQAAPEGDGKAAGSSSAGATGPGGSPGGHPLMRRSLSDRRDKHSTPLHRILKRVNTIHSKRRQSVEGMNLSLALKLDDDDDDEMEPIPEPMEGDEDSDEGSSSQDDEDSGASSSGHGPGAAGAAAGGKRAAGGSKGGAVGGSRSKRTCSRWALG